MDNPIIPRDAPIVYITFSSDINPTSVETLIAFMAEAVNKKVKSVYLALTTPGGSVRDGLHLYNFMKGVPFELMVHNTGNVDSIGNAIFLAGKKRYAAPTATFTFHGVGFGIDAKMRLEERNIREYLDMILADQKRIGSIIASGTNLSTSVIAGLFRRQQTKDAKWAIDKGVVSDIRDLVIPSGSPVIPLVFRR